MEIILAKTAGFCYGVKNAVESVEKLISNKTGAEVIKTLGPVIHNEKIMDKFEKEGVRCIDSIDDASKGDYVVIRAHGVGEEVYSALEEKEAKLLDVTCPYVHLIHKRVKEESDAGRFIIVVGDKEHPEVIGIQGWAKGNSIAVKSIDEIVENKNKIDKMSKNGLSIVVQTTFKEENWRKIIEFCEKTFQNIKKFDTICSATTKRQSEAIVLAKKVEGMIVIGSRSSSNTLKLKEVCEKHCKNTFLIADAEDINLDKLKYYKSIGITAGASTPDSVIKEVISKMSELQNNPGAENFEELLEQYSGEIRSGKMSKGTVINVTDDTIYVDLGGKSEGMISVSEFEDGAIPQIGDEIEAKVYRVSDKDGIFLSIKSIQAQKKFKQFSDAKEEGAELDAEVIKAIKGGAIAKTQYGEVFIPLSQLADRYVEKADDFVGKTIKVKILSVDEKKRSVKASAKEFAVAEKQRALQEAWDKLEVGAVVKGTVKNFTDFRAFIDLGGIDGSIHISEISWNRIKHPSEVLTVGDKVEVKVLSMDPETRKIGLGFRKAEDNPWYGAEEKYAVDNVVTGKVARIVPFGAFINLAPSIDGLVHISQISDYRLDRVEECLQVGDEVDAKVVELDIAAKKIGLSIKAVAPINTPEMIEEAEKRKAEREARKAEREARNAERAAKKAEYEAKKAEKAAEPKEYVEDMTNTIGDFAQLAELFADTEE